MGTQFGEEHLINQVFPEPFVGYAVDVGAADGHFLSDTDFLEERGWTVLCIEPNPLYDCKAGRKLVVEVACAAEDADDQDFTVIEMGRDQCLYAAASALKPDAVTVQTHRHLIRSQRVIKVAVRTLNRLLVEAEFPRLDFACIDAEGGDMEVLQGLDLVKWQPRLIIIENWWDDERFTNYLKPYGYGERTRIGVNDCFIRQ